MAVEPALMDALLGAAERAIAGRSGLTPAPTKKNNKAAAPTPKGAKAAAWNNWANPADGS